MWIPGILSFTKYPKAEVSSYNKLIFYGFILVLDMECSTVVVVDLA
jgi:hypothetical protein